MWKKTRQNAENKQTFDLSGKIEIAEKLVKTLKTDKLLIWAEKLKLKENLAKTLKINKLHKTNMLLSL